MKRFAIVLTAVASIALVGCKKKEETKVEPTPAVDTATAPKPTDTAVVAPAAVPAAGATTTTTTTTTTTDADLTSGITECDDLVKRYNSCEKLPAEQKAAFLEGAKAWKASATTGSDDVKKSTADSCKQAATSADAALKQHGC